MGTTRVSALTTACRHIRSQNAHTHTAAQCPFLSVAQTSGQFRHMEMLHFPSMSLDSIGSAYLVQTGQSLISSW